MANFIVTPALLREIINYDSETGKLYWKERSEKFFSDGGSRILWNSAHVGKEIFNGTNSHGYFTQIILGKQLKAHTVAWAIYNGKWPTQQIDHINGVKTDNRICNLRDVSAKINSRNRVMGANNTSGITGVYFSKKREKWIAFIGGRSLGAFDSKNEASEARKKARAETSGYTERHGNTKIVAQKVLKRPHRAPRDKMYLWPPTEQKSHNAEQVQ